MPAVPKCQIASQRERATGEGSYGSNDESHDATVGSFSFPTKLLLERAAVRGEMHIAG